LRLLDCAFDSHQGWTYNFDRGSQAHSRSLEFGDLLRHRRPAPEHYADQDRPERKSDDERREAQRRLRRSDTPTRVLILTTFGLTEYVYEALRAGASGFLLKDSPAEELLAAVRVIARGDALLDPAVTRSVIEQFTRSPVRPELERRLDELTPRELEVMHLLARGLSNAEIAADLVVSEGTVKTHVARVLQKLDLRDRVQAVIFAYESGLVGFAGR
jgi:DNA-binding NarL/FixJ family response regulator